MYVNVHNGFMAYIKTFSSLISQSIYSCRFFFEHAVAIAHRMVRPYLRMNLFIIIFFCRGLYMSSNRMGKNLAYIYSLYITNFFSTFFRNRETWNGACPTNKNFILFLVQNREDRICTT